MGRSPSPIERGFIVKAWRNVLIRFGLVNIPVSLAPAKVSAAEVETHRYGPDGERVRQAWIDSAGNIVESPASLYDTPAGPVDIPRPEIPGDPGIDLEALVPVADVDPILYDAAYAIWPGKGGDRSFSALAAFMEDRPRAALTGTARFTDRPRDVLIRYVPALDALILHTLTFGAKLRAAEIEAKAAAVPMADPADVAAAETFLDALPGTWTPTDRDPMDDAILAALEAAVPGAMEPPIPADPSTVPDLCAALRAGGIR